MNRETRTDPTVNNPVDENLIPEDDAADLTATDADWPEREGISRGAPPPDDGDNDSSSYGLPVDGDHVQDEGVAESLGKAITAPVLDAADAVDGDQDRER